MKKDANRYSLLVVEDNPGDYILIEDYLEEQIMGPEITQAATYKEAVNVLDKSKSSFQVILLDLTLPDKSGEELIMEMVEKAGNLPVIVLTGFTNVSFAIKSLTLGVSDYLLKDDLTPAMLYKSIIYNIERKKNLVRLQESEKRYSDLFQLSPLPMWVFDMETLRILDANNATVTHYGYSLNELLGLTIREFLLPEDVPVVEERVRSQKENKTGFYSSTSTHVKKDGSRITVEIQSNPILFKNREARLVLANDITVKESYVSAIEQQNKTLREIAWIQSHVVRAPLARIMGLIDLFQNNMVEDSERESVLEEIQISASEMDGIVKEIVSKSEQIKLNSM